MIHNIQHVLPVDDILPHTEFCNEKGICECDCKPEHREVFEPRGIHEADEPKLSGIVIIHNSFDGREGVEWANEALNPQICYKTKKPCSHKCEGLCKDSY